MSHLRLFVLAGLSGLACSELAGFEEFSGQALEGPAGGAGASATGGSGGGGAIGAGSAQGGSTLSGSGGQSGGMGGASAAGGKGATGGGPGPGGDGGGGEGGTSEPGAGAGGGPSTGGATATGAAAGTGAAGPQGGTPASGGTAGAGGNPSGGNGGGGATSGGSSSGGSGPTGGTSMTGGTNGEGGEVGGCDRQLLTNAGFESGATAWAQDSTWPGVSMIVTGDDPDLDPGISPYAGSFLAWLGGVPDSDSGNVMTLIQNVEIPEDATQLVLTGFVRIETDEVDPEPFDLLHVELLSAPEEILALVHTWTNQDATNGWVPIEIEPLDDLDDLGILGETVPFQLHSMTDRMLETSFYFDQLRLVAECGR